MTYTVSSGTLNSTTPYLLMGPDVYDGDMKHLAASRRMHGSGTDGRMNRVVTDSFSGVVNTQNSAENYVGNTFIKCY